ncbi:hypothetical protein GGTG_09120 [Gaeumannomyces tritici R3-111a-1]|uniref:Uncharacterized protein n=1 Tax=Gaeumannomyces tritici (strain R3-111a-1) TaxID=644352 RepID=J3P6H9_GAET3|nr:hypothetical protein GGTG_09120 [Gaeumannomyces tritici R3-111a-1]EJT72254.1 hypothetical protein GGTG_09120 [Gaeumannomyces tritici R3-111a-1]
MPSIGFSNAIGIVMFDLTIHRLYKVPPLSGTHGATAENNGEPPTSTGDPGDVGQAS